MNVGKIRISPDNVNHNKNSVKPIDKDSGQFSGVLREIEIRTEIASKCSKIPAPHVLVDPRAITRMAKDQSFYDKVMSKIDSYTSNQNISLHYPSITYSLVVDEDGEWTETMTNEELKKLCEESSKTDKKSDPLKDLFGASSQAVMQHNTSGDAYGAIDYRNALIDIERKLKR